MWRGRTRAARPEPAGQTVVPEWGPPIRTLADGATVYAAGKTWSRDNTSGQEVVFDDCTRVEMVDGEAAVTQFWGGGAVLVRHRDGRTMQYTRPSRRGPIQCEAVSS